MQTTETKSLRLRELRNDRQEPQFNKDTLAQSATDT